jgi:hypothetical protein
MSEENKSSIVETLTPAIGIIDADKLLNNIEKYISEHAILPEGASATIALWCLASYSINSFRIYPKLFITSPEKRCGKSTVLDLIEAFSYKPLIVSNMTPATIYRVIDQEQPTLIIDEADTFLANGSTDMTGIINSGHSKSKAHVMRCVGDGHEVKVFSTWTPMVLAAIGLLPSTIMDRSIVIPLKRKAKNQTSKRIEVDLLSRAKGERKKLLKWSIDKAKAIEQNQIEPPSCGNDRAVDNWLPMFTIAKLVSDNWFEKCKTAYVILNQHENEPELSTLLLADIKEIFNNHNDNKISSADLVNKLNEDKEKPWCECKGGRAMSQSHLAQMLKGYGIKSKGIRVGNKTLRGYELQQFTDTFDRYL